MTSTKRSDRVFSLQAELGGPVRQRLYDFARPPAEGLLGLSGLARVYDGLRGLEGPEFMRCALDAFRVRVDVSEDDLARVPRSGPTVVVANHPFGGIEGIVLGHVLGTLRPDVKIMANYILGRMPELADLLLLVDPFDGPEASRRNVAALREAVRFVKQGGALVVFPAGEVAHLNLRHRRVEDPPWSTTIARLIRKTHSTVVPAYFHGRNSDLFQTLGLVHARVRTALLGRELLARSGKPIELRVGGPVPFRQIQAVGDDEAITDYIRSRTDILGARPSAFASPVQPRATPAEVAPIVEAQPPDQLEAELERLPVEQKLAEGDGQSVYVARASQIPRMLCEIGRARELSFRAIGEGTGRETDLDRFDESYRHLFVWHHAARELVGAYRLGCTDELMAAGGLKSLYTSTLFDYKRRLFESMGPAVEMGRSFIRPEYQKSYAGLLLLWKGIGQFVLQSPRHATLFGPVSISADYQSVSQRLIISFLEQNKFAHEWSRWVRPLRPPRAERRSSLAPSLTHLRSLEDVSEFLGEIEADRKGVPVLLKQYLKLGGRLLGFNVDPDFSNVLDVLIMVDLRQTAPRILARYMGREGAARFLAGHAGHAGNAGHADSAAS